MAHEMSQSLIAEAPRLPRVDAKQERAIVAILGGATDREAAEAARVRRETVCRWRHEDPAFVAELARRRQELWASHRDALRSLLPKAVVAVAAGLEAESPATRLRAAALVLKTLGVGEGERAALRPRQEPTTAPGVLEQWRREAEAQREADDMAKLLGLM